MLYSNIMREQGGWPGHQETHPDSARSQNPLFSGLRLDRAPQFAAIVNMTTGEHSGIPMAEPPFIVTYREGRNEAPRVVIAIPYDHLDEQTIASLRGLLQTLNPEATKIREEAFLHEASAQRRFFRALRNRVTSYQPHYYIAPSFEKQQNDSPYLAEGIFLIGEPFTQREGPFSFRDRGRQQLPSIPTKGVAEIHLGEHTPSEVELAYQTVMLSLILANRIDLSSEEKIQETLPLRREIFMKIYHTMLRQMIPPATREEIFGLDGQIRDIEMNLYNPLRTREGKPMNTILLGAPGVGKSFVMRYFDFDPEVLTIPLPVTALEGFEAGLLKYLSKIRTMLDLPIVVAVDDVEALFHERIMIGYGGSTMELNPARRAKALSILERMEDTHEILLLCAINHPDIEAAFLRRLNPVYFPLPSVEQRQHMLEQTIPRNTLSRIAHQALIAGLVAETEGFNYSGLALIPTYLINFMSELKRKGPLALQRGAQFALGKAGERTNVDELRRYDAIARETVRGSRRSGT